MTRYVIDAPTILALVTQGRRLNPDHQLVAPNSVRSPGGSPCGAIR
ncbi:hypothetical protein [Arthrobacter sp. H20]|nr:hypothetical protein [Arthrobacter sp. H20]